MHCPRLRATLVSLHYPARPEKFVPLTDTTQNNLRFVCMKTSGIIAAVLAGLCMGTMGVFSRKTGLPAEVITFFRLFIGAGLVALLAAFTQKDKKLFSWPGWVVLLSGVMLAGFIIFYVEAMNRTTMANAIMVLYLSPLAASIIAHFFLGEKLTPVSTLLIATALFGFAMMMEFRINLTGDATHVAGLGFSFLGLCCYTSFILLNRMAPTHIHSTTRTFYQLLLGAFCMLAVMGGTFPPLPTDLWPWLIGVGIVPGFLGILLAVIALEKLPAATFGTLAYMEPIFVVVLGWTIFDESLGPLQLSGCALIILSGIVTSWLAARKTTFPEKMYEPGLNKHHQKG